GRRGLQRPGDREGDRVPGTIGAGRRDRHRRSRLSRMTDAPRSRAIALAAASAARDKQAADVVVLDVADLLSITDYFVICSASSNRQLKTVIEAVEERVRDEV